MGVPEPSRRILTLTLRRFLEMAWARHARTRYLSVGAAPFLVALVVPGLWWVPCAAGALLGMVLDNKSSSSFERLAERLEELRDEDLREMIDRHIVAIALMSALYVVPYMALCLAPAPGPAIGAFFCAGSALVCACLHVMTPRMIFFTIPAPLIGLIANGLALGEGLGGIVIALAAAMLGANAIIMARAGAMSFGDLIGARLVAEEAAEGLERRVKERTEQLALATRRAQGANRAKSIFLANMSHELRTPLNAIIGYAEIVEEDLTSGDIRACPGDLTRIRASAAHLLTLINEVLDLSRIEAGKLDLKLRDIELKSVLQTALETARPMATRNGTRCTLEVASGVGLVHADEVRLQQCLLNLLSNAAKFTRDGAILLRARLCTLSGGRPGVAVDVCDTGKGIASEDLAKLFQPFVQADTSLTRPHDGAGLGLAITRRLARAMGGDVAGSSKVGVGSTFTLFLPAAAIDRAAA